MIVREVHEGKKRTFVKTYSDEGKMIERDGEVYEEAIDPMEFDRTYTETDIPIEGVMM